MKTLSLRFASVAMLFAVSMAAFSQNSFPGGEPSRKLLKAQEKADINFTKGDYGSALEVYEHKLAPLGDKYSQYMVGYMYLAGKGVQEDAILASAWYRLAAQRENAQYIRIRDGLLVLFTDEQRSRSDQLYVELRQNMGDLVLISKLIRGDIQVLRRRTGTEFFIQAETERGNFGQQLDVFDAAAERINSRLVFRERQMAAETTLEESEKIRLAAVIREATREVDAYVASR